MISVTVRLAAVAAVYFRPSVFFGDQALKGADYFQLHLRRIAFAQNALFGPGHFLPAWYPREMLGTPFSANIQSFPWIPSRLLLLLVPNPRLHYELGVWLAASLAALFTYLYSRRAGLSELASITAGWTFASAGYFASRVFAGHLPLLEAYPSLPLLLWLADRATAPDRARFRIRDLSALAVAAACFAVAGHPQIPAYSFVAVGLFLLFRPGARNRFRAVAALALGAGATLAVWWPMLLLIRRSTRVLDLDPPSNDVTLPYARLRALLQPWIDGWTGTLDVPNWHPFSGYPNAAWFWDTTSYMGLVPVAVIVWLLVRMILRKRLPVWPLSFLTALGAGALLCALPAGKFLHVIIPAAVLRSPARLLYLSTFAVSLALGFGVDVFLKAALPLTTPLARNAMRAAVAAFLLFHAVDLGGFARIFVQTVPWQDVVGAPTFAAQIMNEAKDERVAGNDFSVWCQERYDDPGGFDSVILADPYRILLALNGYNPRANEEEIDSYRFSLPALRTTGVGFVISERPRPDLERLAADGDLRTLPRPQPRAPSFVHSVECPRESRLFPALKR